MADNKNLPQATIAEYVAGAKDMETRKYVSEKILENLKKEKKRKEERIDYLSKSRVESVDIAKQNYSCSKYRYEQGYWSTISFPSISIDDHEECFLIFFFLPVVLAFGLFYLLFIAPICYLIKKNEQKKAMNKAKQAYEEALSNLEKPIPECEELALTVGKLDCQIGAFSKTIDKLENALKVYYQAGIIPPDYRNAACVEIIDYVFRNDQADTMREATLLCNQYQWHGELMDVLHELGSVMVGINNTLNDINNNISALSADIEELASGQREIAKESKLARYAAESSAKSAEYMEWRVRNHIT